MPPLPIRTKDDIRAIRDSLKHLKGVVEGANTEDVAENLDAWREVAEALSNAGDAAADKIDAAQKALKERK